MSDRKEYMTKYREDHKNEIAESKRKYNDEHREEIKAPEPDIVFLLDIPANEGLSRLAENRSEQNVQFERLDRLLKVREAYLDIAKADSAYFVTIDARKPLEEIISEVYEKIIDYMDDKSKKRT